jgi:RNA polymerase sigma factor (sigma-70 family)
MKKECFRKNKNNTNQNFDTDLKNRILVESMLSILNERDRKIIELYYLSNLQQKEIALILNISPNTVSKRMKISLELLREKFKIN